MTKYFGNPSWSEDDWEEMNSASDFYAGGEALAVAVTESATKKPAVKKLPQRPVKSKEEKREARLEQERQLEEYRKKSDQQAQEHRAADDKAWFWTHLTNMLFRMGITLEPIDDTQRYAATTDGQVCRVVYDDSDTQHPATAAKETAQKIVLFFAQQKLTRVIE